MHRLTYLSESEVRFGSQAETLWLQQYKVLGLFNRNTKCERNFAVYLAEIVMGEMPVEEMSFHCFPKGSERKKL